MSTSRTAPPTSRDGETACNPIEKNSIDADVARLFDASLDLLGTAGPDGYLKRINPAWSRTLGYSERELLARPILDFGHPDDREAIAAALRRAAGGDTISALCVRGRCADGSYATFDCNLVPRAGGQLIDVVARDITERKRAEDALQGSETLLRAFFDSPGAMRSIVEIVDGHIVHVVDNAEATRFFASAQKPVLKGWPSERGIAAEIERLYLARYEACRRTGQPVQFEYARETPRGVRWLAAIVSHIGTAPNGHHRFASIVVDITDRVLTETALRESQHDLAEAQRIAHIGSWTLDPATGDATWSPEMYRILGLNLNGPPLRLADIPIHFRPDSVTRVTAAVERAVRTGEPWLLDLEFVRPDGTQGWVASRAEAERDTSGQVSRIRGTMADITDRVEAEAERSRLILAIEQSADAIAISQIDGPVEYVNAAFERLYGYRRDEVLGQNLRILKSGRHTHEFWEEVWDVIRAGETWSGPIVNRCKDGTLVEVETVLSGFRDANGRPAGLIKTDRDVSRERALEAQLRQAQKMEAIGQLAGGVAHDFNNMLTAIRGYTELVREHLPADDEQDRTDLEQVILAADRAAELTRQLLAFARRQVLAPRVLDPDEIVAGIAPLLRRLLGEHIELTIRNAPDVGQVRLDPVQLEQVILNLALNARDAMPGGGRLTIETANVELDGPYAAAHPDATAGPHVVLAVGDTGAGMDAATREHIFEPFFTTKDPGEGTGMGLATVYGIVRQSGGSIHVYSEPGHGTTFRIHFPRVTGEPAAVSSAPPAANVPIGTETILVVEDEPAVRGFAHRTLSELAYTVLEAGTGTEALALAAGYGGAIELVVTDVIMPGMHGAELARQLTAARPGLRTLFVSGFTESTVLHHGGGDDAAYLPKPFSGDALSRAVRAVLDGAPRR